MDRKHINWLAFVCHRQGDWAAEHYVKTEITVINASLPFFLMHQAIHNPLCNYPLKICNNPRWSKRKRVCVTRFSDFFSSLLRKYTVPMHIVRWQAAKKNYQRFILYLLLFFSCLLCSIALVNKHISWFKIISSFSLLCAEHKLARAYCLSEKYW